MTTPTISPDPARHATADLKALFHRKRQDIQGLHDSGASGPHVCSALTDACDEVVRLVYMDALERASAGGRPLILRDVALVAVGGYGRGDQAPCSDVDLLFLHAPKPAAIIREFISHLVRTLWDAGLKLSQSVRAPTECIAFARQDFKARTALIEARLLTGSAALFAELQRRVHRLIASTPIDRFIRESLACRTEEHRDYYSETVCLLEPNVKKSPGGLRELHLLRWVAVARYATPEPHLLRLSGILSPQDADALTRASEFLHRIRNELHFRAATAQDVLTRDEQLRLAEWLKYEPSGPLLAVERFMQDYYRHTTGLHDVVMRFADRAKGRSPFRAAVNRLLRHRVSEHFVLNRDAIAYAATTSDEYASTPEAIMTLFDLAGGYGVPVEQETVERVRAAAPQCVVTPGARAQFLRRLAGPAALGHFIRDTHRVGLLERLVPAFAHARCLIQYNLSHMYTVDEHSIRALEATTSRVDDTGPIGQAYREIRRKDILHLAILLHDLGKGLGPDHCEAGRQIADETASQFAIGNHERDLLVFLVHQHLLMAHTAFRRDLTDTATIVQFARSVATPETLRMLYVLTAADIEAVAPGEWTAWKASLLGELYSRAMEELTGEVPVADEQARSATLRNNLMEALVAHFDAEWLKPQLETFPLSYLLATESPRVADHLRVVRELEWGGVRIASEYRPDTAMMQYTVVTHDGLTPGLFSKIAGTLAAVGFQIVNARIVTRSDGVVVDTFDGVDMDFAGEPPTERRFEVARQIEDVLLGRETVDAVWARRGAPVKRSGRQHSVGPPKIEIDNDSSDRYTIIEVFADDRLGLLYSIARTLFEQGLSVASAKIATHEDQIVDAFYVTTQDGRKVTDADRLDVIRRRLLEAI